MGEDKLATIYDVALRAGVSPKTVSRVLNGDGPVGFATRAAVEAAMAALDYVPSNAARAMRSSRSGLVGVITGAISTTQMFERSGLPEVLIVQGIQQGLADSGLTIMIADTGGQPDRVPGLVGAFLRHRAEGIIHVAEFHQKVSLPAVPKGVPLVLANGFDDRGTPSVLPDDRRGQRDLVARLIAAGHRRIGMLHLRPGMVAGQLRPSGYRDALEAAGLPVDPDLIAAAEFGEGPAAAQLLWDVIDRMLALPDPPTVLCCGNDRMAVAVYAVLRERGLSVPGDISVAGYDNHRLIAETLHPALTTVELPYSVMGLRAGQLLAGIIAGQPAPEGRIIVAGPVCWRASVAERRDANVIQLRTKRED
jgi:LacI family transcriptional regulator